jgi:hypothetical protein
MICPNKSSKEWYDLRKGLKERFKQEGKDYTDEQIEDLADLAFHRYGDIPTTEKAIDYLNRKIGKEESQFNKWVNYGKGQFISNQGDLSFENFKQSFSEKFGTDISDENIQSIYDESKNRYDLIKEASGALIDNVVAAKQEKEGKTPWHKDLIPAIRNYFTSNYNMLGKVSQASKDAAAKFHSSASQASIVLKKAVNEITKKYGGETWNELRKTLVESRLRGVKDRWSQWSRDVKTMSEDDIIEQFVNGSYPSILSNIEGRTPLSNLSEDAQTLIEKGDFEQLRTLLSHAFDYASQNVAKMDFSDGRSYDEIINDPNFQGALNLYKNLVEKPIAENHASNDGVFSDALGELDTYFPLIPMDEKARLFVTKRNAGKLSRIKNAANNLATGLANAYDTSVVKLNDQLTEAFKANNKSNFVGELGKAGLLKELGPFDKGAETININGEIYPAKIVEVGEGIIRNGKYIPPKKALIPEWLYKELKPMLEKKEADPTVFSNVMNAITKFSLGGIFEPAIHTANLVGALTNGTPFPGTNWASKTIGNTPVTKVFTGIFNIINEDVNSESAINHMQDMANNGLLSQKSGAVTWSKKISEATGATKAAFYDMSPFLYGTKGVDLKARVLMDRICLEINPKATPEQRRQFANQLGNYVKGMEGKLERTVKGNGIAPFYTASSTFLKNGIKGWLGMTPLPTEGMSLQKRATMRAAQMLSAGAVGLVGTWVGLYKAQTGKYPWEDKESTFLKVPLNDKEKEWLDNHPNIKPFFYKNGKWNDVNMGFLNRTLDRGAKGLGIDAVYNTQMQGATVGQTIEEIEKDQVNSFLAPLVSSPGIHLITTGLTGHSPYISSLIDYNTGKPTIEFQRTTRTMDNAGKQLGANLAQGFLSANPLVGNISEGLGMSFKPEYGATAKEKEDVNMAIKAMRGITDITFPNLFKPHINNDKKAAMLKKEAVKTTKAAKKESGEVTPGTLGQKKMGGGTMKSKIMK